MNKLKRLLWVLSGLMIVGNLVYGIITGHLLPHDLIIAIVGLFVIMLLQLFGLVFEFWWQVKSSYQGYIKKLCLRKKNADEPEKINKS